MAGLVGARGEVTLRERPPKRPQEEGRSVNPGTTVPQMLLAAAWKEKQSILTLRTLPFNFCQHADARRTCDYMAINAAVS